MEQRPNYGVIAIQDVWKDGELLFKERGLYNVFRKETGDVVCDHRGKQHVYREITSYFAQQGTERSFADGRWKEYKRSCV